MVESIHSHFSRIARRYKDLRRTDIEPILYIKKKLQKCARIKAADVGCGDGRYDLKLCQYLGEKLFLYCVDCNQTMLDQLTRYLIQHKITNFQTRKAFANDLPLEADLLDCLFTFNAIHHFPLLEFLSEASRVLKESGRLFIYTRLRSQNRRNIWGRYFPLFAEKETRLYELNGLEKAIRRVSGLSLQSVKFFTYGRVSSLERLVEQARNCHYSTFNFYTNGEFEQSLEQFKRNLRRHFQDLNHVNWVDENVLLVVGKRTSKFARERGSSEAPEIERRHSFQPPPVVSDLFRRTS